MGELTKAAVDLVDRANAGDQVAMATLHLVGENARKRHPFRACVVYELAMRYIAAGSDDSPARAVLSAGDLPHEGHEWLWRKAARGDVGNGWDVWQQIRSYDNGKDAAVSALSLGPRLTDRRFDRILSTFLGDPVARAVVEKGMNDPNERHRSEVLSNLGADGPLIEALYFLGACLMLARARQALASGNLAVEPDVMWELESPRKGRRW
jgi:hypothetical protein